MNPNTFCKVAGHQINTYKSPAFMGSRKTNTVFKQNADDLMFF